MASWQLRLQPPPKEPRAFELWLQHAAGRILIEDVRAYAQENINSGLSEEARAAAEKGIDDALYGLMMVIDGVSGTLANETQHVELSVQARLVCHEPPNVVAGCSASASPTGPEENEHEEPARRLPDRRTGPGA